MVYITAVIYSVIMVWGIFFPRTLSTWDSNRRIKRDLVNLNRLMPLLNYRLEVLKVELPNHVLVVEV